ncbi:MAG: F420-dependent NADP oxidoreductase [Planctomycetaceae bacterium]|nr:F420-dependent NADP oxidoreductase [Planctomycetaceae bacterium]PJE24700.1 MAG: F420-dependent NADP oxidoreductase [Mycobacterium sp.]
MRIGILGAGSLGTAIGTRLATHGHDIMVGFSKTSEGVTNAATAIGGGARPGAPDEVAAHGEVVLLATPWTVTLDLVADLRSVLSGKILWDTTNPLAPGFGELLIGTTTSAGEEVAKAAPQAVVVKAIAPFAEQLRGQSTIIAGRKPSCFVCGDNAEARRTIVSLINNIGADPVDAGPLQLARFNEPAGMLLVNLAFVQGYGPGIGTALLRER